jgi:hypothetical protein
MITKRFDLINYLIKKNKYKSYLEVGTNKGQNFRKVKCKLKECIDPVKRFDKLTYNMTSDKAFKIIKKKYDIIFIDGLHIEEQVDKDILNSLNHLNKNGTIVLHDCNPSGKKEASSIPRKKGFDWNGTVYKSIINLRYTRKDLDVKVIDMDYGCGVVRVGSQELYNKVPIDEAKTWKYFNKKRKELLNLVDVKSFIKN